MNIEIKRTSNYASIVIMDGGATVDSGLLNDKERNAAAEEFVNSAYNLWVDNGRSFEDFLKKWIG